MQPTLALPQPKLVFDPPGGPAQLEKPVNVKLAIVQFSDGLQVDQGMVKKSGVFIYRSQSAGASEEFWNEQQQQWQIPGADLAAYDPMPFTFQQGETEPWQSVVIAAGQKDANDLDRFNKAGGSGFPRYRLRAYMQASRNNQTFSALSAPSNDWQFVSAADTARFGIAFQGQETAQDATKVRLLLKDAALSPAAMFEIRAAGNNEVEIANFNAAGAAMATLLLKTNGEIVLRPGGGRKVVIDAPLEVGNVYYQPIGGGVKRWLA